MQNSGKVAKNQYIGFLQFIATLFPRIGVSIPNLFLLSRHEQIKNVKSISSLNEKLNFYLILNH